MQSVQVALNRQRPIDPWAVRELYASAGWWPERQEPEIAEIFQADLAVGAWDGERLVGFARVVSDHRFRAFIEDVVVHSDYRQSGVGSRLVATLVESPDHIETITLFCEPDLVPFYERRGFKARRSQVVLHRRRAT